MVFCLLFDALMIFLCVFIIVKGKGPVKLKITKFDKIFLIATGAIIVCIFLFFTVGYRVLIFIADKKVEYDFYEEILRNPNYLYENGICFRNNEIIVSIYDKKNLDSIKSSMENSYNATLYPTTNLENYYRLVFRLSQSYSELNRIKEEIEVVYDDSYAEIQTIEYGYRQQYREMDREYRTEGIPFGRIGIIRNCFLDIFGKK